MNKYVLWHVQGGLGKNVAATSFIADLKEVYKNMEADDLEYVKDNIVDFFKKQTLKRAILKSVEILETKGDFEEIKNEAEEINEIKKTEEE